MFDNSNAKAYRAVLAARAGGSHNQKALALVQARRQASGGVQAAAKRHTEAEQLPHCATATVRPDLRSDRQGNDLAGPTPQLADTLRQPAAQRESERHQERTGSPPDGQLGEQPTALGREQPAGHASGKTKRLDANVLARKFVERRRAGRVAKSLVSDGAATDALNDPTLKQHGHTVNDLNANAVKSATGAPPESSTLTESEREAVKIDQGNDWPRPGSLGRGALGPRPKTLLGLEADGSAPPMQLSGGVKDRERSEQSSSGGVFRLPEPSRGLRLPP